MQELLEQKKDHPQNIIPKLYRIGKNLFMQESITD